MHSGRTRLLKSAAVMCGAATMLASFSTPFSASGEEIPVIRTQADLDRGKSNVRSVIEELAELFAEDAPVPVLNPANLQIQPPYSKVIQAPNGRATLILRPRFTNAKQMSKALDSVITGSALVEPLEEQNELIINAGADEIESYRAILEAMDVPPPQILIEAKVVEVMFSDGMQRNLSLMFQGPRYNVGAKTTIPGSSSAGTSGATGDFTPYAGKNSMNIAFQWLETAQDAVVLSSPNILISRNEMSQIVTGEEIPIQEANSSGSTILMSTIFKNVGVTLEVEPSMINHDNVTLRVRPKVSNVLRYESITSGDTSYPVPVISARSVETHLRMHDKQVVMMGGLYSQRTALQQERIPIISDLPFIGELFTGKNETKEITQLLFLLKVHIIPPEQIPSGIFYDFDRSAKVSNVLSEIVSHSDSFPTRDSSNEKFRNEIDAALPGKPEEERRKFKQRPTSVKSAAGEEIKNVKPINSDLFVMEPEGTNTTVPAAPQESKPAEVAPAPEVTEPQTDNDSPTAQPTGE